MLEHVYELLEKRVINPRIEFLKLYKLFSIEKVPNEYDIALNNITLEQYINQFVFRKIPLRSTFLEVNHLIQCYVNINNPTLDNLFLYCEILYGIFTQGMNEIIAEPNIAQQYAVIIENIMIILEKTNHEFIQKADNQYIIVEKNKTATQAANIVTDDTVSLQILEYNHYSLKGNLEKSGKYLMLLVNALSQY